ncbi:MAG: hypothetical protein HZC51_02195 [Nitrospirae bacterium]|nr:hypothetical protein [Nitrospirota bacterium]
MSLLQDSSEIKEAARLIAGLLGAKPAQAEAAPSAPPAEEPRPAPVQAAPAPVLPAAVQPEQAAPAVASPPPVPEMPVSVPPAVAAPAPPAPASAPAQVQAAPLPEAEFRGDRLENALSALCRRAGFTGAVVADRSGLALALYNSPVDGGLLAAFTSVLGDALEKAGPMLGQTGAESISMDINYTDKVVLRRFNIDNRPYFLMVLCPQTVEERSEIEVSIDEIASIMTAS